jgi:hypothetical protein
LAPGDPTPAQKHVTNTSTLRDAAILGAQAIFDQVEHSLRGDLILLLREEVAKIVEHLEDPSDAAIMEAWMELAKSGVH